MSDTTWANQYLADHLLSERMQEILEGLEAELCGVRPSPETGEREEISEFHSVVSVHYGDAVRHLNRITVDGSPL